MVNEKNVYLIENKKAQVEEVREIENEDLQQEQKKLDEKKENKPTITESVKEVIVPKVHALDDDDDDSEAKIVHVDTIKEARQHNADEFRKTERDAAEGDCKIL
jgi:hypothetical protein